MKSHLFSPITLRGLTIPNRIFVSPMCQYSSRDGFPTDWHMVHLGSRAVGGAGLVMMEATAVSPEGRISPDDAGIWSDEHAAAYARIVDFIREQGAVPAIQLAHSGRKGSSRAPWLGNGSVPREQGGWIPEAPSPIALDEAHPVPRQMTGAEVDALPELFATAARRALATGFQVAELHMAHGYLLHSFLSPLTNHREDEYGGSLENRMRAPLAVAKAVRAVWPAEWPLFVRISATDWVEGGWDLAQSIELAREMKALGVDLIDTSSGGLVNDAVIPVGPGYQVEFAAKIRQQAEIATGAVGLVTEPFQAEQILRTEQADVVLLARELLRDPYWPRRAAAALGQDIPYPLQYQRAQRR